MPIARHLLATLITALVLTWLGTAVVASAEPKSADRTRQKQQAEQERTELRRKLDDLKADIAKTEQARGHAADALATSEQAISNANRKLRELAAEQQRTQQRLQALSQDLRQLESTVTQQRKRLAQMLREQYRAGQEDLSLIHI